MSDNTKDMII